MKIRKIDKILLKNISEKLEKNTNEKKINFQKGIHKNLLKNPIKKNNSKICFQKKK